MQIDTITIKICKNFSIKQTKVSKMLHEISQKGFQSLGKHHRTRNNVETKKKHLRKRKSSQIVDSKIIFFVIPQINIEVDNSFFLW